MSEGIEHQVYEELPARIDDIADGVESVHAELRIFRRDMTRRLDAQDRQLRDIGAQLTELLRRGQS